MSDIFLEHLQVGSIAFSFSTAKSCKKTAEEFLQVLKKYLPCLTRAVHDIELICQAQDWEPIRDIPVKIRTSLVHRGVRPAGQFQPAGVTIEINASKLKKIKAQIRRVDSSDPELLKQISENLHQYWLEIFLHEVAHYLTPDEDEAEEYMKEWMLAL